MPAPDARRRPTAGRARRPAGPRRPSRAAGTTPPTPASTPSTSPVPPSAPTNLTASEVRTGSVTLTWTAATSGCCAIAGYDITYYQEFGDIVFSASVGAVTSTTITAHLGRGPAVLVPIDRPGQPRSTLELVGQR